MFSVAPAVQCSKHVVNIKDKNYKVCNFFFQYNDWIVYHKRLPTGISGKTHLKPIKWNGSMDISSQETQLQDSKMDCI